MNNKTKASGLADHANGAKETTTLAPPVLRYTHPFTWQLQLMSFFAHCYVFQKKKKKATHACPQTLVMMQALAFHSVIFTDIFDTRKPVFL